MGTNPSITSIPRFNSGAKKIDPYTLTGLRVKVLNVDLANEQATIQISFNYNSIQNDVSWTGDIILPDITGDTESDMILTAGKTLTIDQSKAVNSTKKNTLTNDFINPASLRLKADSKTVLEPNSSLIVTNHSTLIIEDGAQIIVKDGAKIIIEPSANIQCEGGNILLDHSNSKLIIKGKLITADYIDFNPTGPGSTEIYPSHQLALGTGSKVIFSRPDGTTMAPMFDIKEGTFVIIQNRDLIINNCKGYIRNNSKLCVLNGKVTMHDNELEGTGSNNIGIENTPTSGFSAIKTTLKNLTQGLIVHSGLLVNLNEINADNCPRSIELNDIKEVNILQGTLTGSSIFSFHLLDVGKVASHDVSITNNSGVGYWVENTPFFFMNAGEVKNAITGIKVRQSNVFIRSCAQINYNDVGIDYIDNTTNNYSLTIGDYFGAKVADNAVANIRGKNIVLNIDAKTHQYNLPFPYSKSGSPNNFSNSPLIFDICYDGQIGTIPMRGNYWGPAGHLSAYAFSLKKLAGCNTDVMFDANLFKTYYGCSVPVDPETPPIDPDTIVCPKCEFLVGIDTIKVHEQNKLASQDVNREDLDNAVEKYDPISTIEATDSLGLCDMMKRFAYTMTLANENLSLRNRTAWDPSVIRYGQREAREIKDNDFIAALYYDGSYIKVASDEPISSVTIYNNAGTMILNKEKINTENVNIPFLNISTGLYWVILKNAKGNFISERIIIQ